MLPGLRGFARLSVLGLAAFATASCPAFDGSRGGSEMVAAAVQVPAPADEVDPGEWPEPERHEEGPVEHAADPLRELDPERVLVSIAKETLVREGPSWDARKIGYLRAGAVVRRDPDPASTGSCPGGWYRVDPDGYVCVGRTASLDPRHPIALAAGNRPARGRPLPYVYGRSRFPTPPFYVRVPTVEQQRRVEPDLARHLSRARADDWADAPMEPVPEFLRDNRPARTLRGYTHSRRSIFLGRARPESGFAFVSLFQSGDRKYGLTVDMDVVPLDRVKRVRPSAFAGVELHDALTLPIAFTRIRHATLFEGDPRTTGLRAGRRLGFRESIPITGQRVRRRGVTYLRATDGGWLRADQVVRLPRMRRRPSWATPGRTWIDVSILRQSLVAYVGERPVYATLVSTGVDGLGDPEKTHSTVRGRFLIHTKHVTATMSSDEVGDEFDLRDVPYVQYFTEGYALHAAYWHDGFGKPRSHGCINLSPRDASWLFEWSDPPVPPAWHGAMSLRDGTLVYVHP